MINSVEPTALQTMSNDSGRVFIFNCSILWFITHVLFSLKREVVFNKNDDFLVLLSTRKNSLSGLVIARGMPGRPPPLPKSNMFLFNEEEINKESAM